MTLTEPFSAVTIYSLPWTQWSFYKSVADISHVGQWPWASAPGIYTELLVTRTLSTLGFRVVIIWSGTSKVVFFVKCLSIMLISSQNPLVILASFKVKATYYYDLMAPDFPPCWTAFRAWLPATLPWRTLLHPGRAPPSSGAWQPLWPHSLLPGAPPRGRLFTEMPPCLLSWLLPSQCPFRPLLRRGSFPWQPFLAPLS